MLSLTGVLVAGSAAALVNTQVLSGTAPASNSVSQLVEVSDDGDTSSSVAVVGTPAPSSSATSTSVTADDLKVYEVQDTGRVSLDTSKDVLRIVSVEPIAPWRTMSTRQIDSFTVEVRFVNGEAVVVFTANLLYGEVTTNVGLATVAPGTSAGGSTPTSSGNSTPGTSNSTGSTPTSVDDDDDDRTSTSIDDDSGSGKGGSGGGGDDDDHSDDDD